MEKINPERQLHKFISNSGISEEVLGKSAEFIFFLKEFNHTNKKQNN